MKVLTSLDLRSFLDLNKNELRNAVIQVLPIPPVDPVVGQVYYNSDPNDGALGLLIYNGSTWEAAGNLQIEATGPIVVTEGTGADDNLVTISISAASGSSAGSMSSAHYSLVAGATDAATNSAIVKRDGSGNFAANVITANSITINNTPSNATDAATKGYVDALKTGLDIKDSVLVATTAAITLSGTQTIDGVTLVAGNRVLVKNQANAATNGIYVVGSSTWSRSSDANSNDEVTPGLFVFVERGTDNQDTGWVLTTDGSINLGVTDLAFTQFSGAGQIAAGAGLSRTGNTLDVNVDDSTIEISSDTLRVKAGGISSTQLATGAVDLSANKVTGVLPISNGGTGSATVNANIVFAGPSTGSSAAPSFRSLVSDDIPSISTDKLTSGTLGVARGGTGVSTFTAGIVKSTGGTNALTTDSTISLTAEVSGTLPVANGGTGATTLTSNGVLIGGGTSAITATVAGSAYQVLRVSSGGGAPVFGAIDLSQSAAVTGALAVANGGTGATTASGARSNLGATTKYTATIGNGSLTTVPVTHNLNTQDVVVEVYEWNNNVSPTLEKVYPDIKHTSVNTIDLIFSQAPSTNQYKVVIVG